MTSPAQPHVPIFGGTFRRRKRRLGKIRRPVRCSHPEPEESNSFARRTAKSLAVILSVSEESPWRCVNAREKCGQAPRLTPISQGLHVSTRSQSPFFQAPHLTILVDIFSDLVVFSPLMEFLNNSCYIFDLSQILGRRFCFSAGCPVYRTMDSRDVEELTCLWTAAQRMVSAFLRTLVPNPSDREDLLQQVAVVIVQKFPQYDRARPFTSWAIGIAKQEVLAYRRHLRTDRHLFNDALVDRIALTYDHFLSEGLSDLGDTLEQCLENSRAGPGRRPSCTMRKA